jgi:hypothetical protein
MPVVVLLIMSMAHTVVAASVPCVFVLRVSTDAHADYLYPNPRVDHNLDRI